MLNSFHLSGKSVNHLVQHITVQNIHFSGENLKLYNIIKNTEISLNDFSKYVIQCFLKKTFSYKVLSDN